MNVDTQTGIKVKLTGTDGNAFALLGRVKNALRKGGHADKIDSFLEQAMSGDYNHLLKTCMNFVEVS